MKQMPLRLLFRTNVMALLVGCILSAGMAAAQGEQPASRALSPATLRLSISEGAVSLEAKDAPISTIFHEIGLKAGIEVENRLGGEVKITTQFERLPLEEAIKRLVNNVAVFYTKDPGQPTHRIAKVVLLSEGQRTPLRAADSPLVQETPTAKQAVPTHQPFRFEFDPSQHEKNP
jgi:hypothetical protein